MYLNFKIVIIIQQNFALYICDQHFNRFVFASYLNLYFHIKINFEFI